ncbi:hypothetical protein [Chryseobacterium mucoviscidosis]|uniref:hypothetical protein n=1 Tax=Chryseobacterium mucoviscidosis TaxID=1945581 RepID=UPI0031DBB12B
MIKLIDYVIFHLDCLYKKMDKFKYKDRGFEKFWLVAVISSFINLNVSSIDNVFLNNYFHTLNKYIFLFIIPIIMYFVYYFFVKNERFLEYGFKESKKGYLILIILFVIMIILMAMVEPVRH